MDKDAHNPYWSQGRHLRAPHFLLLSRVTSRAAVQPRPVSRQAQTETFRALPVSRFAGRVIPLPLSPVHLGKQAQNLEIEPDQRDHDSKGAIPLHVLGSAGLHATLDEVEIEHQIQRGDGHYDQAESDPDRKSTRLNSSHL